MTRVSVLLVALGLAGCGSSPGTAVAAPAPAAASQQQQEQPLLASVRRLAAAWNAGDAGGWAAEFWPDGSLINILGVVFPNARAVETVTSQILAGPFRGSTFTPVVRRVRFIGPSVAIVDTDVSVEHFGALPPGAVATAPGLLLTRLTHVYENRAGVWKIAASQNTAVLPSSFRPSPS